MRDRRIERDSEYIYDLSQDHAPLKKAKFGNAPHDASKISPSFYENLSEVHLTSCALRELDRRTMTINIFRQNIVL
ncbi:hypothetical protein F5B18DRAFT_598377 [Nemania serpens]|nr:hypothetical protein F5B18DRAFT_598377 [Nemania serpens]